MQARGRRLADVKPTPFTIAVPQSDLDDLRERLSRTRWADDFDNEDWRYGVPEKYLREIVDYWLDGYDWRAHEKQMNAYANFTVDIDEVPIHFLHVQGSGRVRVPLILTHGWPWSFWDFKDVLGPLTDPHRFGLDDALAFDVVVPSLPGYGFSSPLRRTGVTRAVTADLWAVLMTEVLGYDRFVAQGGDWGAFVTANLAHAHADKLIGAHMSLPAIPGFDWMSLQASHYAPDEAGWFERWTARMATARPHSIVHRSSPQTLGWAFNDSPVGLLAWLVERRRLFSDCDGDVENVFSKDFLLTLVSIYWFTQTAHTSMRSYADSGLESWQPRHDRLPVLQAPTGVAVFPMDTLLMPRSIVAAHADLKQWTVMPRGGHFAPAEQPELLVADIRKFVAGLSNVSLERGST